MKDKYNPHAETPDEIFIEEICFPHTKNRVTIARWHYRGLIIAQYICTVLGVGSGIMLSTPSDVPPEKPVHLEKKDVNGDGIDDLILIDKESKNYDIFIGQKDQSYVDIDTYYFEKGKDVDRKVDQEKESIEDKVKQQYKK